MSRAGRGLTPAPRPVAIGGAACVVRDLRPADAAEMHDLRVRNREFFTPFEPALADEHFTLRAQQEAIAHAARAWDEDREYAFGVALPGGPLVGRVRLSVVVRGPWQNANLGYYVDRSTNGRGVGTEAVGLVVRFAFERLRLHRVQAAVMPRNAPSIRVLEKNGFRREGLAPNYLRINGAWEDHAIFARTREDADPLA
jgi:ribosomal-protein-alanine N-acetyltransferase